MQSRTSVALAGTTVTLATITLTALAISATTYTYSSQSGGVRCEIYNTTLCVPPARPIKAIPNATRHWYSFRQ